MPSTTWHSLVLDYQMYALPCVIVVHTRLTSTTFTFNTSIADLRHALGHHWRRSAIIKHSADYQVGYVFGQVYLAKDRLICWSLDVIQKWPTRTRESVSSYIRFQQQITRCLNKDISHIHMHNLFQSSQKMEFPSIKIRRPILKCNQYIPLCQSPLAWPIYTCIQGNIWSLLCR